MGVENRRGDPHLLDDVGHPGALVPFAHEQPGGGGEDGLPGLLVLLGHQIDVCLPGGRDLRRQAILDGVERQALLLEAADVAQQVEVPVAVDGPAGGGLLGRRQQSLAHVVVDGAARDSGGLVRDR